MNWKKILLWCIGILIGGGALIASATFGLLLFLEKGNTHKTNKVAPVEETTSGESEDFNKETVNKPVEEDAVTLADGTNGHTFIANWHNFYNNTLGWGKIDTASYTEQKEAATSILQQLNGISVKNKQIENDLNSMKQNAQLVIKGDDREAMRKLHRYFHDLDIFFNGYDYNQTFGVTEFTGK
ncbi:hypothetical protein [Niallia sp. 03133]|uniref:hypothetical protein n=1 Tax=Niallia sp. 03133 TaxID=3458060 RepID=UPI004045059A